MEKVKTIKEASEESDFPAKGDSEIRVSLQEKVPLGDEEHAKSWNAEEISKLESDLLALVSNIQVSADAKESLRRKELEEARKIRSELLEWEIKTSQEKFEEISSRWSLAKEVVIPQELQETLKWQRLLCEELIEDKKKLIKELQQELKSGDERYVKDLRKQAEDVDLMMQRSEELVTTLTQAYRDELAHIESMYQQEHDVLLTKDQTEWEQCVKKLWDQQQEILEERRKIVDGYEAKIHNLMMDPEYKYDAMREEHDAKFQELEREQQQMMADNMIQNINYITDMDDRLCNLAHMKKRILSLESELRNLKRTYTNDKKESEKESSRLSDQYKRNIEHYQRMQQRNRQFAATDTKQFEETWRMLDKEVRQQVEKALLVDAMIWKQVLGLAWARPRGNSLADLHGPDCFWKEAGMKLEGKDGVAGPLEEEQVPLETMKELMELLCDESGFLTEDRLPKSANLDKKEQNVIKLETLFHICGMDEEEDIPSLANFILKYQQREADECLLVESHRKEPLVQLVILTMFYLGCGNS
ncbi:dynein regulatory complex protein 1 isoform X2 [Stigmatopora nigra]